MFKFLRNWKGERGQVLPLVLALLAIGALTIVPSLNYAASNLNGSRSLNSGMKGTYAADAGVEDALWCLARSISPPTQLTGINNMLVNIQTENKGEYTLYFGELIEPGGHNDYLDVVGEIVWDEVAEMYQYTITVTWQPEPGTPPIKLDSIGARLPLDYSYVADSAALFAGNLSQGEPAIILDSVGAEMVNWSFGSPAPEISESQPIVTQAFYITGTGEPEGEYTWIVANRTDVGAVGELTGGLYRITSVARRVEDNSVTARIVTDALINPADMETWVISWQTVNY